MNWFIKKGQLASMLSDLRKEINNLKEIQNETIKRYGDLYYEELDTNRKLEDKLKKKDKKIKELEEYIEKEKEE